MSSESQFDLCIYFWDNNILTIKFWQFSPTSWCDIF